MRSSSFRALFLAASVFVCSFTAKAEYPNCIDGTVTPAALTAWRNAAAADAQANDPVAVAAKIQACFPTQVPSCLVRTQRYGQRFDVADAEDDSTYANTPERQLPPELLAPNAQGFQYFVGPEFVALAKQKGWTVVPYKSRHSGGFDSGTSSLFMVYVPGSSINPPVNYDRWLNFALPADTDADALNPVPQKPFPSAQDYIDNPNAGYPQTLTMVSQTRATATTPARVYFQMFNRASNGSIYVPSGNSSVSGCQSCHPNGLRAISPLGFHVRAGEPQLPKEIWKAVKFVNDEMDNSANGRLVSWRTGTDANGVTRPFFRPESQWPVVGAIKPMNKISRTQAFILGGTLPDGTTTPGCYKSRPSIPLTDIFGRPPGRNNTYTLSATPIKDWRKVRNAMLCETCHNGRIRSTIHSGTSTSTIDYKILVDQSMPPAAHLNPLDRGDETSPPFDAFTPDERISLANCLNEELKLEQPLLGQWLTQEVCQ